MNNGTGKREELKEQLETLDSEGEHIDTVYNQQRTIPDEILDQHYEIIQNQYERRKDQQLGPSDDEAERITALEDEIKEKIADEQGVSDEIDELEDLFQSIENHFQPEPANTEER